MDEQKLQKYRDEGYIDKAGGIDQTRSKTAAEAYVTKFGEFVRNFLCDEAPTVFDGGLGNLPQSTIVEYKRMDGSVLQFFTSMTLTPKKES